LVSIKELFYHIFVDTRIPALG